jgi:hypothetical protein
MISDFVRGGQLFCPPSRACRNLLRGVLGLATLFTLACSRHIETPSEIVVKHELSPEPARVGLTLVSLALANGSAKPVTGARIDLEADMTHAGMALVFAEAKEVEPGHYTAEIKFEMAGDWMVLLHITLPGGQKLDRQFDVRGVRSN